MPEVSRLQQIEMSDVASRRFQAIAWRETMRPIFDEMDRTGAFADSAERHPHLRTQG